jgi:FkbM family methyltransferase
MTAIWTFVPTYKNVVSGTTMLTTHALSKHLQQRGIQFGISAISSPDIEWVRNFALTYFYDKQTQATHLLFIDDDMGFMPDVVTDMLAFGEPVVGAVYPKKVYPLQWAVSGIDNPEERGPFVEIEGIGCGCFMVRRDAVTMMLEKMPHLIDTRKHALDNPFMRQEGFTRLLRLFDCYEDPRRGRVSEDISFGIRYRECGGRVWACTNHKMVHVGPHEYVGTFSEWTVQNQKEVTAKREALFAENEFLKAHPIYKAKACKHGLFIYNPNDTYIGRSMEEYGEWCEHEIDLLRKFVNAGDTVIDCGANIGTHSVALARIVGNYGKVFALEAQPRLCAMLEANVQLNQLGNVFFVNKAVGNFEGNITIGELPPDDTEFNFGAAPLNKTWSGESIPVSCGKIDSFAGDFDVSLIKIDIEGMEVDAIKGAKATIERCKPILFFEYSEDADSEAVDAVLKQIGYLAYWAIGPFFHPLNAFKSQKNIWPTAQMLSLNLIAFWPKKLREDVSAMKAIKAANLPLFLGPEDNWRAAIGRMAANHPLRGGAEEGNQTNSAA